MIGETYSLNPIDYFLKHIIKKSLKIAKSDKKSLDIQINQQETFQFNKRKQLILYKDIIGEKIQVGKLFSFSLFTTGLLLSTYINFRKEKLNNVLKKLLISLNLLYYSMSYMFFTRIKEIRSIHLEPAYNNLIVKTNDHMKFKIHVQDVINFSSPNEPFYKFCSYQMFQNSNKLYFFIIQQPEIKTSYKSQLFKSVMEDHFEINLK
jgi:hypothetical protein